MPEAAGGLYWETAIMWPQDWDGGKYCADGHSLDIVGCDRNQEDADETHQRWCNSEALARMAHAIVRMALPTEKWHTTGRFGTWAERLASEGR
ncbi:hypothetical protein [Mycobacterium sp. AZCC_0083]|uniref:hypothetical protein n=1 Tax=Mycobacterium sp. AZCC_0083 TaxID=2735882 RepID=UPI001617E355|nr:hypothetical protein [Mycobacterium sp. AZCC_0083]MBB5167087.1 hypothetical protein [Mycobacterium sp. AZCC_0083]